MPCNGVTVLKAQLQKRDRQAQELIDLLNEARIPLVMEGTDVEGVVRLVVHLPLHPGAFLPVRVAIEPGGKVTAITQTGTFEQGKQVLTRFVQHTLQAQGVQLQGVQFEAHTHAQEAPQLAYSQQQIV